MVQGVVKYTNYDKLKDVIDSDDFYDRNKIIRNITKLYGKTASTSSDSADGLDQAIYWAALENYTEITNGTITNFSQLEVRPLKSYEVNMNSQEDEYVDYRWIVTVQGYDENDVESEVQHNDDGLYDWWEWETSPGFEREVGDSERRDWGITCLLYTSPSPRD